MVHAAVVAGLLASDCQIIELGPTSTPLVSFAIRDLGCSGGISITGSHNDTRWNALKFVGPDGSLLNALKSEELLDVYHASAFRAPTSHPRSPQPAPDGILDSYETYLCSLLDCDLIRSGKFRIAVDLRGGALGPLVRRLASKLSVELVLIHDSPRDLRDRPEPTAKTMGDLGEALRRERCDAGFALNVDGDRLGVAVETGLALSEEMSLPLVAWNRLSRRPGTIVTNLSTSNRVDYVAREFGQSVLRTAVGESHVIDRGLEEAAVLAGEGSGGVAVLPSSVAFDALLSMGQVLELMASERKPLSEIAGQIPQPVIRKGEIRCPAPQAYRAMECFREEFEPDDPNTLDGVRVDWDDLWVHVRVSKTEPLLRIIVEGSDQRRVDHLFNRCLDSARRHTGGEQR
jgi:phosphomannomutase